MKRIRPLLLVLASLLLVLLSAGCFERFSQHKAAESAPEDKASEGAAADASGEKSGVETDQAAADSAAKSDEAKPEEAKSDEAAPADGGGDAEVQLIQFTPEQLKEHGVKVLSAGPGRLEQTLTLPGEVAVNADKVGHVLPRLPGVIQRLTKNIGDQVKKGELLAVLDSRELAEAKSTYLTAVEQVKVAQGYLDREQKLYEKGVSAEQDYIAAQNALKQAQIVQRAAEQNLSALGVSAKQLATLSSSPDASLTRYEVYASSSGRVLEKHVSTGEMVATDTEMYLIADLSSVWVNLSVSQKDLPKVKEGQSVHIRFNPDSNSGDKIAAPAGELGALADASASIKYIDALVAEDTRAATARVVLSNPAGAWRPGMFVSGLVATGSRQVAVLVPLAAVIPYDGNQTVFVEAGAGFEPRTVVLGMQSATHAEVLSGLKAGEQFVSDGTFMVKADLGKSEASED